MAGISVAISEALEDLSEENFQKFCHRLLARKEAPVVRRKQVEKKSYLEVTDVLVSTFTEAGALTVCVEILTAIGCNNEAQSLVKATNGPAAGEGASKNDELPSGAANVDGKHFVDKHRLPLTQRVTHMASILDELLDKGVIQDECYQRIMKISIDQDRMRELYSTVLKSSGERGKDIFLKILEQYNPYLIEEIMEKSLKSL
ncbi:apoptosis-associated speck-like protein containing a CARD [Synchiropus picturatus]